LVCAQRGSAFNSLADFAEVIALVPRVRNAFREPWDWLHFLLGFLSAVFVFYPVSLFIVVAFIIYEALQAESPESSYFDLVEFLCGFMVGLIFRFSLLQV
jgi:hypothetical protein